MSEPVKDTAYWNLRSLAVGRRKGWTMRWERIAKAASPGTPEHLYWHERFQERRP